jgi:hypothetical protein
VGTRLMVQVVGFKGLGFRVQGLGLSVEVFGSLYTVCDVRGLGF